MRNIRVERELNASRTAVWGVLADFANIADWNSGVKKSFATGDLTEGVGATRHCDLSPIGSLEETVRGWQPGNELVVSIDSASKLPIRRGQATFGMADAEAGSRVSVSYDYETKYGLLGRLLGGRLDKQLVSGFNGFLTDLEAAAAE